MPGHRHRAVGIAGVRVRVRVRVRVMGAHPATDVHRQIALEAVGVDIAAAVVVELVQKSPHPSRAHRFGCPSGEG